MTSYGRKTFTNCIGRYFSAVSMAASLGIFCMVSVGFANPSLAADAANPGPGFDDTITCNVHVGDVVEYVEDGKPRLGLVDPQHEGFYWVRFPKKPEDKLTLDEIKKIRWTEDGLKVGNKLVEDSLPDLLASEKQDELYVVVNTADAANAISKGNFVRLTSTRVGNEPSFYINAFAYRSHKLVMHANLFMYKDSRYERTTVYQPDYALEQESNEKLNDEDSALVQQNKLSFEEWSARSNERHENALRLVGAGGVASLNVDCTR
jgi:hypothetical protein